MNILSDIYWLKPGEKMTFANDTKLAEIYNEAYANEKVITDSVNYKNHIVIECLDINNVKVIEFSNWLVMALVNEEDKIVYFNIPQHIKPKTLITTTYTRLKSKGVKGYVKVHDDGVVSIRIKDVKEKVNVSSVEVKPNKAALFRLWVEKLPYDIPFSVLGLYELKYAMTLGDKFFKGVVKFKNGRLIKCRFMIRKLRGQMFLFKEGLPFRQLESKSVNELSVNDVKTINRVISQHGLTISNVLNPFNNKKDIK